MNGSFETCDQLNSFVINEALKYMILVLSLTIKCLHWIVYYYILPYLNGGKL